MNKREKFIRAKKQKALIKETQTQFDRLIDNLVTGKKNLRLAFMAEDEGMMLTKMSATGDYMLEALEDVVAIRYAFTELAHRYWKIRRQDKEKAERLKLMKTPHQIDVELPPWFDGGDICIAREMVRELYDKVKEKMMNDGSQQGSETQA